MNKIIIPIYNIELSIHQGEQQLEGLIADGKIDDRFSDRSAFVFDYDDTIYVWFMDNVPLNIVVHECVHIVSFVYTMIVATKDLINDEHEAYLMQWLFEEIKNKIKTT
jgi:hypothetical protein